MSPCSGDVENHTQSLATTGQTSNTIAIENFVDLNDETFFMDDISDHIRDSSTAKVGEGNKILSYLHPDCMTFFISFGMY